MFFFYNTIRITKAKDSDSFDSELSEYQCVRFQVSYIHIT